jgi:hypothetical protein
LAGLLGAMIYRWEKIYWTKHVLKGWVGVLLLMAFTLLPLSAPAAAECLHANTDGQVAEGRLAFARFIDYGYGGRKESAYILVLPKSVCLDGPVEYDQIESSRKIHVFSLNDTLLRKLKANVGKMVRVSGNPFGEHTAHHHAPIVMDVSGVGRR